MTPTFVTTSGKSLRLDPALEINRGGEGRILALPELPRKVAKIYHDPAKALSPEKLLALQVLPERVFVRPEELIWADGQIIGFVMAELPKAYWPVATLFSAQFCQKKQLDEAFKWRLIHQLRQAIQLAHQSSILIGDLSGLNVQFDLSGHLKLIDVDAYGTPANPHSGTLLDEIRDELYPGPISPASDYFAFAVLVFNLLTFVHPFKGTHPQHQGLADRMIHRLPIFAPDPRLTVPKCYVPVTEPLLIDQFTDLFVGGQRRLLALDRVQASRPAPTLTKVTTVPGELITKQFWAAQPGETLLDLVAVGPRLLLKSSRGFYIYDVGQPGHVSLLHEFSATAWDEVFIGEQRTVLRRGREMFAHQADHQQFTRLDNLRVGPNARSAQFKNILVIVEDSLLKYAHLDEINKTFIRVEQVTVFDRGLAFGATYPHGALWQQAGGQSYLFYHSGKHISSLRSPYPIHSLLTHGPVALVTWRATTTRGHHLQTAWATIPKSGNRLEVSPERINGPKVFAHRPAEPFGFIFEPADNALLVRRTGDFAVLQTIACQLLSNDTLLASAPAGILAAEGQGAWLLNKK